MISISQALEIIRNHIPERKVCELPLAQTMGHILAHDVYSDILIPPFDRATMDGYALRSEDVAEPNTVLKVVGESSAGRRFCGILEHNQAVRIMTGAPVPAGADCVQMVEKTNATGDQVVIEEPLQKGKNIAPAGSEVGTENKLEAGRYLGPAELAVLASFGAATVSVFSRPRVALLVTGDELVEVESHPGPDQIRNSNAYSLMAQLRSCIIEPTYLGTAPDNPAVLRSKLEEAMTHDIALATGGVSMGKYDLVADILRELNASIHFDRVSIKPGKPLTFATRGGTLFFGLPGNPVSSFVAFEVFVRPVIAISMGRRSAPAEVCARICHDFSNHGPRDYYAPARTRWNTQQWETEVLTTKGSADIFRFSCADSLAVIPADSDLRRGAPLRVLLLNDYLERITS